MEKSPSLTLTKRDAVKSGRDALLVAVAGLLPQLLEIMQVTDFGDNTAMISIVLAMVAPLINRFTRNVKGE